MEALFRAGEEVEEERQGDKGRGKQGDREKKNLFFCPLFSLSPPPLVFFYFALIGNSRSKTNSIMISVRATAEVFAAK
jgi:hypothetical protein